MPSQAALVAGGPIPHRPKAAQGHPGAPPKPVSNGRQSPENRRKASLSQGLAIGVVGKSYCHVESRSAPARRGRSSIALAIATTMTIWAAQPASTADAAWPNQVQARYRLQFNGIEVGSYDFTSHFNGNSYSATGRHKYRRSSVLSNGAAILKAAAPSTAAPRIRQAIK